MHWRWYCGQTNQSRSNYLGLSSHFNLSTKAKQKVHQDQTYW